MSDTDNYPATTQATPSAQFDTLVVDISNNLTTELSKSISNLLDSAQNKLFDKSNSADNNEDQVRYFELMNQIRTLKVTIADNFNNNIREYLVSAEEFETNKNRQKSTDDNELSLVEQDDMEGIVLVKGIGERASGKYQEQLSHLEARLKHLASKSPNTFKSDLLTPTNFCQAFDDALADNFDTANKKILFAMFDTEIANNLDDIYNSVNKRLIDADILPHIKHQYLSRRRLTLIHQGKQPVRSDLSIEHPSTFRSSGNPSGVIKHPESARIRESRGNTF